MGFCNLVLGETIFFLKNHKACYSGWRFSLPSNALFQHLLQLDAPRNNRWMSQHSPPPLGRFSLRPHASPLFLWKVFPFSLPLLSSLFAGTTSRTIPARAEMEGKLLLSMGESRKFPPAAHAFPSLCKPKSPAAYLVQPPLAKSEEKLAIGEAYRQESVFFLSSSRIPHLDRKFLDGVIKKLVFFEKFKRNGA